MTDPGQSSSIFAELRRRNVYRVGLAYIIIAWLVLQVLDILVPLIGAPDWVPQLFLFVLAIGLPIALLFAWVYELTPEGIKRQSEVDQSESITGQTGRRLDTVIIGIFIVSVGFLMVDRWYLAPRQPAPVSSADTESTAAIGEASIAVLPFANMSADKSSGHFSDGLADTLLHMLAQVSDLRVAARTSSFQFRDHNADIAEIAQRLNVSSVLEGSVQKSGSQIRITAQLIDAESGYHLWSGTYDRSFDDIFTIQDEIAEQVVAALKISLLGEEKQRLQQHATDNVEAYTEYLLGMHGIDESSFQGLEEAVTHLKRATELDPNYALAHAALGRSYLDMSQTGALAEQELLTLSGPAADRALELDPNLPEAIALKAALRYISQEGGDEGVETMLQRAVRLGPNDVVAHEYYATFLSLENRPHEAQAVIDKALTLDPLSLTLLRAAIRNHNILEEYEQTLLICERMRKLNPQSPNGYYLAGFAERARGNWAEAVMWFVEAVRVDPDDPELPVQIGDFYINFYLLDEAERWYQAGVAIDPDQPMAASSRLVRPLIDRDYDAGAAIARELLINEIDDRNGSRELALDVFAEMGDRTGDYSEFLSWTERYYPRLFAEPPSDIQGNIGLAARLGHVFSVTGKPQQGRALLDAAVALQRDADPENRNPFTLLVAGAAGETELIDLVLENLEQEPAGTRLSAWDMIVGHPPFMRAIRERPDYLELAAAHREYAMRQREKLKTLNGGTYP